MLSTSLYRLVKTLSLTDWSAESVLEGGGVCDVTGVPIRMRCFVPGLVSHLGQDVPKNQHAWRSSPFSSPDDAEQTNIPKSTAQSLTLSIACYTLAEVCPR